MTKPRPLFLLASALFCFVTARAEVVINTAFPGGNVLVKNKTANAVEIAPDLRGGKPWFYWYFEAQASEPGRVTFGFAKAGVIGVRGPAISHDDGKTWQWMGAERVVAAPVRQAQDLRPPEETFAYDFTKAGERVRFSVGIPYVQSNLDAFLATQAGNPHLTKSVLTKSLKGRAVEFLQIGRPGAGKRGMLLTARHHACEALASYVMEGFLREALSESPAARRFRETYVLYVVPFVDKDGVEEGDQGKNREPHDHNRDYGDAPIFPEVKAIQEFAERTPLQIALDLHCPALKGDIHEAFHFLGLGVPHVKANLDEWIAWIAEERPPLVMSPIDFLVDAAKPNAVNRAINSHYFATRDGVLMAATLESPYTQPKVPLDAEMARAYGAGLLKALNRTTFISAERGSVRASSHAEFEAWRKTFWQTYRSNKTEEAAALAREQIDDPKAAPIYRVEANGLMALMRLEQGRYFEARAHADAVLRDPDAMTSQLTAAHAVLVRALAADRKTAPVEFDAGIAQALATPYLSLAQQAVLFSTALEFYQSRQEFEKAIDYGRRLFPMSADFEKGRTLNRIAALHDLAKQPAAALAARQEAVALLRKLLSSVPQRSIFGARATLDLFEAVMAIPTSTREEKQTAADLVLNHEVVAPQYKERVRKAMAAQR
ncbi:MAG TPA: M14 family zinc carboxypeptidase [Chthoniobacteraceae bacterium]|jgi:tetratricopeptide (TPR) repeat protein|nr:M14 family zinc carboxypeptidase [Chthoniobacteraceae bacterium]